MDTRGSSAAINSTYVAENKALAKSSSAPLSEYIHSRSPFQISQRVRELPSGALLVRPKQNSSNKSPSLKAFQKGDGSHVAIGLSCSPTVKPHCSVSPLLPPAPSCVKPSSLPTSGSEQLCPPAPPGQPGPGTGTALHNPAVLTGFTSNSCDDRVVVNSPPSQS